MLIASANHLQLANNTIVHESCQLKDSNEYEMGGYQVNPALPR